MAIKPTGRPRGRPRKNAAQNQTSTNQKHEVKHDSSDMFKLVIGIIGRDMTESESQALIDAARIFIKDNFVATQVFDDDVLKETVMNQGLITKKDFDCDDDTWMDEDDDDNWRDKEISRWEDPENDD